MLIHTGEKKFKCDYCPKTFYTCYALKEHVNFHKGIKNFACLNCNKRFMTKTILKRHMTIHTGLTPFVCPYCRKRFKSVTLCRRHIGIHKREVNLQEPSEIEETIQLPEVSSKILDFTDALSDNVFTIPAIINGNDPINVNLMANNNPDESIIAKSRLKDANNILANNLSDEINNESYLLDSDFGSTIANSNEGITVDDTIDSNVDQNFYSTIYVNQDNMQVLIPNDFSSLLSQMKLENNDSIFSNGLHESNIFLSLAQTNDFAVENQNFDSINPNLTLSTINDLNTPETDKYPNQVLPSISDVLDNNERIEDDNLKVDNQKSLLTENMVDFSENLSFSISLSNNDNNPTNKSKILTTNDTSIYEPANFVCPSCKMLFKNFTEMRKHECVTLTAVNSINKINKPSPVQRKDLKKTTSSNVSYDLST